MSIIPKQPVTELWRPLLGVAQGGVARLIEEGRQIVWEDSAYTEENYYGLSLRGPIGPGNSMGSPVALGDGEHTFIFPVGPQTVRYSREYRQAISPTLGGVVVEERGLAWMDITIEGNFGLSPKFGFDSTLQPDSDQPVTPPWKAPLSGPKWTQRMFAHFLDRYAAGKSRPDENHRTTLVWHDYKNDEHWIVIPIKADLNRTIQDRMMYPFTLQLRAVGRTTASPPPKKPMTLARLVDGAQDAVRMARGAVGLLGDASATLTAALGQVRYYAATIDSVMDGISTSMTRLAYFLETKDRLASDIGGMFFRSQTELTEAILLVADANSDFPEEARQALYTAIDQYDRMAAQPDLQADSTQEERREDAVSNAQSEAQSAYGGDQTGTPPQTRSFSKWAGWQPYVVQAGDTLRSIASQIVGDATKWYEIAIRNALKAPYISLSGMPGTATIGDTILIPSPIIAKKTTTSSTSDDATATGLYGRDLKLFETRGSRPGRTQVDIRIDPKTGKDVATIEGVPNLVQACQLKLWTEQGTHMLDPSYGTPPVVGYPNTGATVVALRSAVRAGLSNDSRIQRVLSMIVVSEDDTVDVEATVLPVGGKAPVMIGVSVL
tara:strand:+ start:787 stop:2607 length:1821 start_codon:yes stop_codon:yes gene_type:complete